VYSYTPKPQVLLYESKKPDIFADTIILKMMIWDISGALADSSSDVFDESGEYRRKKMETVNENLQKIRKIIKSTGDFDFILLQQADSSARRSHRLNQYDSLTYDFDLFNSTYTKCHDVFFYPRPTVNPQGKINSGLITMSKFNPASVTRFAYPNRNDWPLSLFKPDYCFLLNRYTLENEKEFILINTFNNEEPDRVLDTKDFELLKTVITYEYQRGNYVLVGGNWNRYPPDYHPEFKSHRIDTTKRETVSSNFMPEWKWAYDRSIPSCRRADKAYDKYKTFCYVTDFYLISPNIEIKQVKTENLEFGNSKHNPVTLTVRLK